MDLPEQVIETEGLWINLPEEFRTELEEKRYHFMGAIHALEHAMIALFPLLVLCDRNDIGGISSPLHEQTESASVFVYDGCPGGIGLAKEAFSKIDQLLLQTRETVMSCGCTTGCPSCVHSPKCGSGNRPIDKKACLILLEKIVSSLSQNIKQIKGAERDQKNNPQTLKKRVSLPKTIVRQGLDALPLRFGVFDLETIRSAEEVGGWHKCERMGISVAVVFDSQLNDFATYLEHEIPDLISHLQSLDLVIGFNNKRFDNRVLSGYTAVNINAFPTLDLLEEVHNYLGYRLSLNRLAESTLGREKSADGLQALQWYKEGSIDLIQEYCKKDVEITRDLFFHALEQGYLLFTNKAKQKVRLPLALAEVINRIVRTKEI